MLKIAAIIISSSLVTLEMECRVKHIALWDTVFHVFMHAVHFGLSNPSLRCAC